MNDQLFEIEEDTTRRLSHIGLWWAVCRPTPPPRHLTRQWYEWHWARGRDPEKERRPLSRKLRAAVIARDGRICGLCGEDVEPADVHIDHIKPVLHGGKDELDNLQVAHSVCNLRKGARVIAGAEA